MIRRGRSGVSEGVGPPARVPGRARRDRIHEVPRRRRAGGQAALLKAKATAARLAEKPSGGRTISCRRGGATRSRARVAGARRHGKVARSEAVVHRLGSAAPRSGPDSDSGRDRDAMAPLATALATADSGTLPPARSRGLSRGALRLRQTAEAHMGDAGAAQKTSAALDAEATARPDASHCANRHAFRSRHAGAGGR